MSDIDWLRAFNKRICSVPVGDTLEFMEEGWQTTRTDFKEIVDRWLDYLNLAKKGAEGESNGKKTFRQVQQAIGEEHPDKNSVIESATRAFRALSEGNEVSDEDKANTELLVGGLDRIFSGIFSSS
ncbi:hypothetical protein A2Z22_04370 [Candidatus Woesebacteria bacterium RBG_16_34_12]|uniref:Uncharacterized protein n=1 Tax=Candidatus Woesebacteria bacterium RBG_16_34_12 TaxID=1802480 RepID=A0A1F7X9R5_9BACT|nr:MAG: hypothetical protein A2Z22_04370 [Candidatus Woesebacteria bacterium RBG_16_34_12]